MKPSPFYLLVALTLLPVVGSYSATDSAADPVVNRLVIHADQGKTPISRNIYGHFSEHLGRCIYEGYWVGENSPIPNVRGIRQDVVAALKRIKTPVLRWPGGCFADEYHWKDGIGPREKRPAMINTHWGGVTENNHFGTHEFMDLCEQIGCDAYVCGNVGSGSVQEMMEWVEYLTSDADSPMANLRRQNGREKPWKVRYFGVGLRPRLSRGSCPRAATCSCWTATRSGGSSTRCTSARPARPPSGGDSRVTRMSVGQPGVPPWMRGRVAAG